MYAAKMSAKIVAETFRDAGDGNAAGVRRDDRTRLAIFFHFREKFAFDVQIFDDGFDNQIAIFKARHIVGKVADRD